MLLTTSGFDFSRIFQSIHLTASCSYICVKYCDNIFNMPPPQHRKKPFSAKQKKEQLKNKREIKRTQDTDEFGRVCRRKDGKQTEDFDLSSDNEEPSGVKKLNEQPSAKQDIKYDPNRYRLHFAKENQKEIDKRKEQSRLPFEVLFEEALETDIDEIYRPGSVLDMPKRPPWDYKTSKGSLEAKEEAYFKRYLDSILEKYSAEELSYFELNLETWRQLWRVLEMADIVLLITDIRHPALHFSPAFYHFVTSELSKPLIVVLNKADLAPASLVMAWTHYFNERFPDITVVPFTSYPRSLMSETSADPGKILHKRRRRRAFSAIGQKQLLEACEKIVQGKVDLTSWREKIEGEIAGVETTHQAELRLEEVAEYTRTDDTRYRDGVVTIGCCGYPNVGKSSLMNGLMGRKVVSVSKTPGHTKHFQTIYLTPTVKMCDSPGLVFPSLVPKPMQILAGIYPIAQVREPYSAVGYLAQRLPLVSLLKITHPDAEDKETEREPPPWTAYDICDAWAEKRGFLTAKAARHDVYRAANHILRLAVDGRICLCTRPPGYGKRTGYWQSHEDTTHYLSLHGTPPPVAGVYVGEEEESSEEEEEPEEEPDTDPPPHKHLGVSNPFACLGDD